jgi:FixJ family two-component response regulator
MPDYDGVELIGYLHARGSRCPVVFVTGAHRSIADATLFLARAKDLQVLGLLRKPVDLASLSSMVASLDEVETSA